MVEVRIKKMVKGLWDYWAAQRKLRPNDVLLASFPKSGNTWVRFIWANLVSLVELGGREIDFHFLNTEMQAEYDTNSFGDMKCTCLPRLVKTHQSYNSRAFGKNKSIFIVRHPGDVVVSYFEYLAAQNRKDVQASSISEFVRDPKYGLPAWCDHTRSWLAQADVVIKYEQLKEDEVGVVHSMLHQLDLDHIEENVIEEAVERSSFDYLRNIEEKKGRPKKDRFKPEYRFMRSGATGEWKTRFKEQDIQYMRNKIQEVGLDGLYVV